MALIDQTALFAANPISNSYDTNATIVIGQDYYFTVNKVQDFVDNYEFKFGINNGYSVENVITVPVSRASTIVDAQTEAIPYLLRNTPMTKILVDDNLFPGQIGFPTFVAVNVLENLDANVIAATRNISNVVYDSWS